MVAEADKNKETPKPQEAAPAKPEKTGKSGWLKYVIFGGAGLVAVILIAVVTLILVGGGKSDSSTASEGQNQAVAEKTPPQADQTAHDSSLNNDSLAAALANDTSLSFLDQGKAALDAITTSLEALDQKPTEQELADEAAGMNAADSLKKLSWLKQEEARLTARADSLNAREKQMNVRESKIQQGIARLEQAESTRITKLAGLYDNMDATAVAKLLANLDDATVVALLPRMKPKNASNVLGLMPPARAAKLSKDMVTIAEN